MWENLLAPALQGDFRSLARCISLIENEQSGYEEVLRQLPGGKAPVIGITGPPGAGKSTLTDALIGELLKEDRRVAVLCIDPSSPFTRGALLGDRIRMSQWYNHPLVYIRSLASRGSLGGLHPMVLEITDLLKSAQFDHILIETVGVGQSEVEVTSLADLTLVVLVPESGDEIQTMKAGLMEIADIFIVNKCDRPQAELFARNLEMIQSPGLAGLRKKIPVIKTIGTEKKGIRELYITICQELKEAAQPEKKLYLFTERAWYLIQKNRMKGLSRLELSKKIEEAISGGSFNLYRFIQPYIN